MKISNIKLKFKNDFAYLTATCEISRYYKDVIYFKFNKQDQKFIYSDASPFAAALLIPAMKQGQDLIIEGTISKQLYEGMYNIMDIMLKWNIGLKPIKIKVNNLTQDNQLYKNTGMFFSGGVDSFYTYLKNKNNKVNKISHYILINGFDIALSNKQLWTSTYNYIKNIADEEKIQIITVESNLRELIEPILDWDYTHGGALASVALSLRKGFKNIFIASTYSKEHQFPNGTHKDTDPLWSTEKLKFIHDGIEASRLNKVRNQIAKSPLALKSLRVCYVNMKDQYNCGKCEKCIRTMISLKISGALNKAITFPNELDYDQISKIIIKGKDVAIFYKEIQDELKSLNIYPNIQVILEEILNRKMKKKTTLNKIITKLFYLDHIYCSRKLYKLLYSLRDKRILNKLNYYILKYK